MVSTAVQSAPSKPAAFVQRFAPNTLSLGYALFLAVNATVIWGGVFPFLGPEFQTARTLTDFFLAQSLAFAAALLGNALDAYYRIPHALHLVLTRPAIPYFFGWCCLIGVTYLDTVSLALTLAGGVLIGFGTAVYFVLWNRAFVSSPKTHATHDFMLGTMYAPLIYLSLWAIPTAMTVYLIPTVFMPLFTLAIRINAPHLYEDADEQRGRGREHAGRYRHLFSDYWRIAVGIGTIGFSSGVVRSLAVSDVTTGIIVNATSMLGVLISAFALFMVWQFKALRLNISSMFRIAYPFLVIAFALLPLFGYAYLEGFAGVIYAVYGCAIMLMMLQCGRTATAREVNPSFVYGFFGCIVYAMHDLGFIIGRFATAFVIPGTDTIVTIAFMSLFVLAMAFYIVQGGARWALSAGKVSADRVDVITTDASPEQRRRQTSTPKETEKRHEDLLARKSRVAAERFQLSNREAEIMNLLVHGYTAKRVAQELMLTENTVNTHVKRMYTKLGVHKRQELVDLVESTCVTDEQDRR
jgi:DNA-binding CsgD family transcriptional regulator